MIPCRIIKLPRNNRSEWLIIISEDYEKIICQISGNTEFYISPKINKGFLVKDEKYYNLIYVDGKGDNVTLEAIDRPSITSKNKRCLRTLIKQISNKI